MTYLNPAASTNNISLMATGVWTTQEATEAKRAYDEKGFEKRIAIQLIAIITSIVLTILCINAGLWLALPAPATIIAFTMTDRQQTLFEQADHQKRIDKALKPVENIYKEIIGLMILNQHGKAKFIENSINKASHGMTYTNNNFPAQFSGVASDYDRTYQLDFSKAINSIRQKFGTVTPLVPKEIWNRFKNACDEYATCNQLYQALSKQYKITAVSSN